MTREEAISALKNTAWIGTDKKVGEVEKAIMMAIEVLKAQNVTDTNVGNNDLISRQEAIELIECMKPYQQDADDICEMLQNMPSAQPERKTGRWIYKDDDDDRYDTYMCSECHHTITVDSHRVDDIGFVIEDMKYCNNCGTKMEGYDG